MPPPSIGGQLVLHADRSLTNNGVFWAYQVGIVGTFTGVLVFLWLAWQHYYPRLRATSAARSRGTIPCY